jgi:hypothetical protein
MGTWTINPDDLAATRTGLGLGTAAAVNTGTTNGTVPVVGSNNKLPSSVLDIPPSGGSIALTASGAIAAGKVVLLNSNGTVTEGSGEVVTAAVGTGYSPTNETAADVGGMCYMTVPNKFLQVNRSTISGSDVLRTIVLDLAQDLAITETVAPTTNASSGTPYSLRYSEAQDRAIAHYQGPSPYPPAINTFSYSSSLGLDIDGLTNNVSGNYPYGSTSWAGPNDNMIVSTYAASPSTVSRRFWDITKGSDASLDTLASSGGQQTMPFTTGGASYAYYESAVWFPVQEQLAFVTHFYFGVGDYRAAVSHGPISGSGGAATWSETAEILMSDSDGFMYQGNWPYHANTDRAYWFDGQKFRSMSMSGGLNISGLQTINATMPVVSSVTVPIPGTNLVVLFAGNVASSSNLSYWVVDVTAGTNATGDSFVITGPVQIAAVPTYHGLSAAYSPDVDAFLVRSRPQTGPSVSYPVRIARTTTNITKPKVLGFASAAAADGAAVTVQLPGAVATPTGGGLTAGTTYYVSATGGVQTTNASLGIAGLAVSSTQLIIEEKG